MKWKWVIGYEGYYKVSNKGDVKSVPRQITYLCKGKIRIAFQSGRLLSDAPNKEGYRQVALSKNAKLKSYLVHKLVLEAFVGPCPKGMESRHRDSNPANNNLRNLSYCSHRKNCRDKVNRGTSRFGGKKNKYRDLLEEWTSEEKGKVTG